MPAAPGRCNGEGSAEAKHADRFAIDLRLDAIEKRLTALGDLFERRLSYDAAKDRAFDVLYGKIREFDGYFQASLKRSLIMSLLLLHDRMANAEAALAEQPDGRRRVAELRQSLLDILYAEDVEPIGTLGGKFDRRMQQAISTVATAELHKADTVERVVREGFVSAGEFLRAQTVVVRRYCGPANRHNSVEEGD